MPAALINRSSHLVIAVNEVFFRTCKSPTCWAFECKSRRLAASEPSRHILTRAWNPTQQPWKAKQTLFHPFEGNVTVWRNCAQRHREDSDWTGDCLSVPALLVVKWPSKITTVIFGRILLLELNSPSLKHAPHYSDLTTVGGLRFTWRWLGAECYTIRSH